MVQVQGNASKQKVPVHKPAVAKQRRVKQFAAMNGRNACGQSKWNKKIELRNLEGKKSKSTNIMAQAGDVVSTACKGNG